MSEAQDAVPKKRGPKTDVLEALLKRVDGLEQKLKDQKKDGAGDDTAAESSEASAAGTASGSGISPTSDSSPGATAAAGAAKIATEATASSSSNPQAAVPEVTMTEQSRKQSKSKTHETVTTSANTKDDSEVFSSHQSQQDQGPPVQVDALLHTYFTRSHAKPFHILDESSFRQRLQLNQIPSYLLGSVCALASR
ncbi:hypothetical protein SBRCBS47491_008354 [Sporothrix bragantina]|uniref:Uncharacterized protein n=1 Tax=Sporothrix bragantina TaxID=671064 RepID=A0ABP0CMT4_9PEZI